MKGADWTRVVLAHAAFDAGPDALSPLELERQWEYVHGVIIQRGTGIHQRKTKCIMAANALYSRCLFE